MGDGLKSAYELAMERLAKKDKEAPGETTAPEKLTAEQKARIAAIRQEYQAKLAEREILFKAERREARSEPEALEKLEEAYRRDREHLLAMQEEKTRAARERR